MYRTIVCAQLPTLTIWISGPAVLAVSAALESANTKHAGAITGATAAAAKAAAADKAASVAQVATPSSR